MNDSTIRQLTERFLNAETTLEEERTLYAYFQRNDIADDLKPYREAFQALAAVSGIEKPLQQRTPAWLIVLRTVTSMAAIFLIGLFIYVNGETPEEPQPTATTNQAVSVSELCEGSTPRELYACYLERKREQPNTYSQLKQMYYER